MIFLHGDGMGRRTASCSGSRRRATTGSSDGPAALRRRGPHRRGRSRGGGHRLRRGRDGLRERACGPTTGRSASTSTSDPVPTLLERARRAGKSTGLVTTAQVTDASPAASGAHEPDRADQSEIARQFLGQQPAARHPRRRRGPVAPARVDPGAYPDNPPKDPEEQSVGDEGRPDRARAALRATTTCRPRRARRSRAKKLLGLFANEEMFEQNARGRGRPLRARRAARGDDLARRSSVLSRRPRRLLPASSRRRAIDEFAHNNNATRTIQAGRALDAAVAVARRFARAHPNTLDRRRRRPRDRRAATRTSTPTDETGSGAVARGRPLPDPGLRPAVLPSTDDRRHTRRAPRRSRPRARGPSSWRGCSPTRRPSRDPEAMRVTGARARRRRRRR